MNIDEILKDLESDNYQLGLVRFAAHTVGRELPGASTEELDQLLVALKGNRVAQLPSYAAKLTAATLFQLIRAYRDTREGLRHAAAVEKWARENDYGPFLERLAQKPTSTRALAAELSLDLTDLSNEIFYMHANGLVDFVTTRAPIDEQTVHLTAFGLELAQKLKP